jgi:hypothetical protein
LISFLNAQESALFAQLKSPSAASNLRLVRVPFMSAGKRKLRLVKSHHNMPKETKQFRCGDKILESGIYRVFHRNHRLAHEVTLLRDQLFPKCAKCDDSVHFELIRSAPDITLAPFKVALYALPANDEEEDFTVAL